jgi:hypothetical protein
MPHFSSTQCVCHGTAPIASLRHRTSCWTLFFEGIRRRDRAWLRFGWTRRKGRKRSQRRVDDAVGRGYDDEAGEDEQDGAGD